MTISIYKSIFCRKTERQEKRTIGSKATEIADRGDLRWGSAFLSAGKQIAAFQVLFIIDSIGSKKKRKLSDVQLWCLGKSFRKMWKGKNCWYIFGVFQQIQALYKSGGQWPIAITAIKWEPLVVPSRGQHDLCMLSKQPNCLTSIIKPVPGEKKSKVP